jgi:hypothetical protein
MPLFVCHAGDFSHAALDHPGCFALTDAEGGKWLCYPSQAADPSDPNLLADVVAKFLGRPGTVGTCTKIFEADAADLPELLAPLPEPHEHLWHDAANRAVTREYLRQCRAWEAETRRLAEGGQA